MEYPRFRVDDEFGPQLEFRYRYIHGRNDIFNPHCHEYYEIFLTISGTVIHWLNGETKPLPEGSLVFIRPNDIHGYIYETQDNLNTTYVNLSFRKELLHDLFQYLSNSFPSKALLSSELPPTVLVNAAEKQRILTQLEELNTISWKDQNTLNLRMRIILADTLSRAFSNIPEEAQPDEPIWLTHLLLEMQQPENFTAGSERMIELSKHSREHVARSLQKHRGITVSEFLNDLKINYASNLLIHTNSPILDICYTCGFQSSSNFYKTFSQKYTLTPMEFRSKYK